MTNECCRLVALSNRQLTPGGTLIFSYFRWLGAFFFFFFWFNILNFNIYFFGGGGGGAGGGGGRGQGSEK